MDQKSQNQMVLKHLQSGKSLSPLEALELYGIFRLGARVWDLKKQEIPIVTKMVTKNGKRFASYMLSVETGATDH